MLICPTCGRTLAGSDCRSITLASDAELRNPHYLVSLKAAVRALALPRRHWRDTLADLIRDHSDEIRTADGDPFEPPEVDDCFPKDDGQRWISNFEKPPKDGKLPRLQNRVLERVRLIDLYFRINHPELAATFGRLIPANDNATPEK